MTTRVPLNNRTDLKANGVAQTHAVVDTWILDKLKKLNNGRKYGGKPAWSSATAEERRNKKDGVYYGLGTLANVKLKVSRKAKGVLKPYRGKMMKLHHLVLLVTEVLLPGYVLGTNTGQKSCDHEDENPANNLVSNLRIVRAEVNNMRKGITASGIRPTNGNQLYFNLPLHKFFMNKDQFVSISSEMKACGYGAKTRTGNFREKIHKRSRRACEVAKSAAARAVLKHLQATESDIFDAIKYSGDPAKPREEFSMLKELQTAFAPPVRKSRKRKRK